MSDFSEKFDLLLSKIDAMNTNIETNNKITTTILNELHDIKLENVALRKRVDLLNDRCDNFERELKKRNLIFDIPKHYEGTNLNEYIIHVIGNVIKVPIAIYDIESFIRLNSKEQKTIWVLVQFANLRKKIEILAARKNLKGTNIYVREDFTTKIVQQRKELIPLLRTKREQGEKAVLRFNKLITPKKVYYFDNESQNIKSYPNKFYTNAADEKNKKPHSSSDTDSGKSQPVTRTPISKKRKKSVIGIKKTSLIRDNTINSYFTQSSTADEARSLATSSHISKNSE